MAQENELYKVIIDNGKVSSVKWLSKAKDEDCEEINASPKSQSISRAARVVNNFAVSYNNPENSEKLRENINELNLQDGTYYLTMSYRYYKSGFAKGQNWYGGSISPDAPTRINAIEGKNKAIIADPAELDENSKFGGSALDALDQEPIDLTTEDGPNKEIGE